MANVPLEKLLDKTNYSIYDLVILASKRAFEVAEGAPKLISEAEAKLIDKPTTIALEEIAEGKVCLKKEKEKKSK
ncbi:MAG: DNA-directed RNA polymerase subunit omega [Candidatus Omnitrophota bacterium]